MVSFLRFEKKLIEEMGFKVTEGEICCITLYKAKYYYLSLDYVEEDPKFPQSLKLPDKIEVDYWSFLNIKIEN